MSLVGKTWAMAGAGLILCGVIGVLRMNLLAVPGAGVLSIIGDLVYLAAVLVLAIGLSRKASVVGRRPLGMTALFAVALWPIASTVVQQLLAAFEPPFGAAWGIYGYLALIIPAIAGLIAALQIARARVVPSPWHWAPAWVLAIHAIAWVIPQIAFVAMGPADIQVWAQLFALLGTVAFLASTLGLGILALVLGMRRSDGVEVYRSVAGEL